MKIEKAIELLDDLALTGNLSLDHDDVDAINLGIEALKRVESQRTPGDVITELRLPGEEP